MEVRVADLLEKREKKKIEDPSCVLQTKIMIMIIASWGPIKSLCNVYVGFSFLFFVSQRLVAATRILGFQRLYSFTIC